MIFIGNMRLGDLSGAYSILENEILRYIKEEPQILRIYYNRDLLYDSTSESNPIFYTSRGVKGNLMDAFVRKYQGKSGVIKWGEEILMSF